VGGEGRSGGPVGPRLLRIPAALGALAAVIVVGTAGYMVLGFGFLDALYQTVTTITTVGFREVNPLGPAGEVFTMVLILTGVGTALYALGALLEGFMEGELRSHVGRRRMDRSIERMRGHVIICGWGRVGTAARKYLQGARQSVVVVDRDPDRLAGFAEHHVVGDVTDDSVLLAAGVDRARALIAALDTAADNVYVTLSARALNPRIVIIARAPDSSTADKLRRAGADRTVNPQLMGGRRMGAFALQPHVADFLDVVMHEESLDYRLEQVEVTAASSLAGRSVGDGDIRSTGALLVALRPPGGPFLANPDPATVLEVGAVLIVLGTAEQLVALQDRVLAP
jgi:voltage-gated potassium channel